MMLNIYDLEKLVTFAKCGTLSKAAEELLTSQPALSRSMKAMEDELGVKLFERKKNQMTFNETGLLAVELAKRVLSDEEEMERRIIAFDRSLRTISIGYCSPVVQSCFNDIMNRVFDQMTITSEMKDDSDFLRYLENGTYNLAVTHRKPDDPKFYSQKCGHEELYISLPLSSDLTFYSEITFEDINGISILLLQNIGYWGTLVKEKLPDSKFLVQSQQDTFEQLISLSDIAVFSSSYFKGTNNPGRITLPIKDKEAKTDYYLVCLNKERQKYDSLFRQIKENTIR